MLGKYNGPGVTHINTIDPETNEVVEHTKKEDIEGEHIKYLPELFSCAHNTPLRTSPLLDTFRYTSNTLVGHAVTAYNYESPVNTDEHTKIFLK